MLYELAKSPEDTAAFVINSMFRSNLEKRGVKTNTVASFDNMETFVVGKKIKTFLVDEYFALTSKQLITLDMLISINKADAIFLGTPKELVDKNLLAIITALRKLTIESPKTVINEYLTQSIRFDKLQKDFDKTYEQIQYLFLSHLTDGQTKIVHNTWSSNPAKRRNYYSDITDVQFETEILGNYLL